MLISSIISQFTWLFFSPFNHRFILQGITVQAVINNITKTFTLNNLSSVKTRQDLGQNGVEDMVTLSDLNEASILWNLRIRQGCRPQKPKGSVIHVKTSTGTTTATSTPTSARSS